MNNKILFFTCISFLFGQQYRLKGLPTMIFLDRGGKEFPAGRIAGYIPAAAFLPLIQSMDEQAAGA